MNIYQHNGYLDAQHIDMVANRNGIAFIVIIGKRQIGKTYNVLKLLLDEDRPFIFMRRTATELDMLTRNVNSPFEKIPTEGHILFAKDSKYTAEINRIEKDEDGNDILTNIGMGAALSTIGNIRGFNGDQYTDVVLDEFIPEEHLFKVRHEGDAFLNAIVTITGNRELEGRPPARFWLLSNANNLNSEILEAMKITKVVEKMSLRGEESRILKDRGIMILLPEAKVISEKRKKTALYKLIGGDSKFSKMAFENEFAYNDYTDVGSKPLIEYNALVTVGKITIHLHKNDKTLYVTEKSKAAVKYEFSESETHLNMFNRKFSDIRAAYLRGRITFQSMAVKNYFLNYTDL